MNTFQRGRDIMCGKEDNIYNIEDLREERKLIQNLKHLKKEQQGAILWLLYHMDILDMIDSGEIMSEEAEEKWMEQALEDNAYIMMVLIQYKKLKDKNREKSE